MTTASVVLSLALPLVSGSHTADLGAASSALTVSVGSASVVVTAKGQPSISFPVTLSKPSTSPVTVSYRTQNVSAKAGKAYLATSGTLTFGVSSQTHTTPTTTFAAVSVLPGSANGGASTFTLTLLHPHGAKLGNPVGVGTILPRAAGTPLRVSANDMRVYDGTGGATRRALVHVTLSRPATSAVKVKYTIVSGSARVGKHYQAAKSGTLKLKAGALGASVNVTIVSGSVGGQARSFSLKLTSASGASISRSKGTVTIAPEPSALMFDDEFNGTSLDLSKWQPNWLGGDNFEVTKPANIAQVSCFDPSQVSEPGDGSLHLAAVARTCPASDGKTYPYASGLVETQPHFTFTYGLMEARIWLPPGTGKPTNWAAFWADGTGVWPTTGELDVMEVLHGRDCWAFHSSGNDPDGCGELANPAGWHTFGARWAPGSVTFFYDGKQIGQTHSGVTSAPMYVVLNLGLGGPGGPVSVPATMRVDWVRVSS